MKAARVRFNGEVRTALEDEEGLLLVPQPGPPPVDIIVAEGWDRLTSVATQQVRREDVVFLAPVQRPSKVLGIGLNYQDHADEQRRQPPSVPAVFPMFASSVIGPGEAIPRYPLTGQTDYEAELGAIIGPRARRVGRADALSHVVGYTIVNDVTARDLQSTDAQWVRGKALDGYAPMGPVIVSPDEFGTVAGHRITCEVNGELRQDSDTGNLIFDLPALIAHITEAITLEPGDVIATGTPSGVGHFMDPPRYLEDGDVVTIRIEGIGELTNPVADVSW